MDKKVAKELWMIEKKQNKKFSEFNSEELYLIDYNTVSEDFIENFISKEHLAVWKKISKKENLSMKFIKQNIELLNTRLLMENQVISENFIISNYKIFNWFFISKHQKITKKIADRFKNRIDWKVLSKWGCPTEEVIRENEGKIDFYSLSTNMNGELQLSAEFYKDYKQKLNWPKVCFHHKLTGDVINDNWDRLNKRILMLKQRIPEEILEKHSEEIDWEFVSGFQEMDWSFIEKNISKLNIHLLLKNDNLNLTEQQMFKLNEMYQIQGAF